MAEKKVTKAAATKAANKAAKEAEAPKAKRTCKKACAPKAEKPAEKPAKKAPAKTTAKAAIIYVNSENAGFKAGDVYQTLAKANGSMTPAEIAKAAKCTVEEVYLGIGWLLKEGKVATDAENKVVLA